MIYWKMRSLAVMLVSLFVILISGTRCYAVEEWKYKELAIITRLENACGGSWDHGLTKNVIDETRQFRRSMSNDLAEFLGSQSSLFELRQRGLAIYLSQFKYKDVESLWEKLNKESGDEGVKKFTLLLGPTRDSGEVQLSIEGLIIEARQNHQMTDKPSLPSDNNPLDLERK